MDFTFAELLRSYRERASLAQTELAAALHIHRNTLSRKITEYKLDHRRNSRAR